MYIDIMVVKLIVFQSSTDVMILQSLKAPKINIDAGIGFTQVSIYYCNICNLFTKKSAACCYRQILHGRNEFDTRLLCTRASRNNRNPLKS